MTSLIDELLCPICHEVLFDPYTTDECGHSYCAVCFFDPRSRLATSNEESVRCSICSENLGTSPVLYRSFTLKSICERVYWSNPEHKDEFLKRQKQVNQRRAERDFHDKYATRKRQYDVIIKDIVDKIDTWKTNKGDVLDPQDVKRARKAVEEIKMRPVTPPPPRPASPPISEEAALALVDDAPAPPVVAEPMAVQQVRPAALPVPPDGISPLYQQNIDIQARAWEIIRSNYYGDVYKHGWLCEFRRLMRGGPCPIHPALDAAIGSELARSAILQSTMGFPLVRDVVENGKKDLQEYMRENCSLLILPPVVPMEPIRVFAPRSCDECRAPGFTGWCVRCSEFE